MAKKIGMKIWSIILSSFTLFTSGIPSVARAVQSEATQIVQDVLVKRSRKPKLFLTQSTVDVDGGILFAGHRSHSSHASHTSHASHYSGSGGSYTAPSPSVPYSPVPYRAPSYVAPTPTPTPTVAPAPVLPQSNIAPIKGSTTPSAPLPAEATPAAAAGKKPGGGSPTLDSACPIKVIHLKNGSTIECDSAWVEGDQIKFMIGGGTLGTDLSYVDLPKTQQKAAEACGLKPWR